MSKKTKPAKSLPQSTDYFSDLKKWPDDWKVTDKDLKIGMEMLEPFSAFIKFLVGNGLAKKTIKNHIQNLNLLGSEIIRRLNDEDSRFRKLPTYDIILKYIDGGEGPLLSFWDPNDPTELAYLKAFDSTCCRLYKFISPPF